MECLYNTFPISRWSSEARSAISQWLHSYTEHQQRSTHCHLVSSSRAPVNNCQVLHHHESWHTEINKKWQDSVIFNFISLNEWKFIFISCDCNIFIKFELFSQIQVLLFFCWSFFLHEKNLVCSFWHLAGIGWKFLWVSYRSQLNPWLQYCF